MSMKLNTSHTPVRLVFELARADNPRLYDELMLFQKGSKRVNRLRTLAYDGLLAQYGAFGQAAVWRETDRSVSTGAASVTNAVFEPSSTE